MAAAAAAAVVGQLLDRWVLLKFSSVEGCV
jgi:hypothetical protein